MPGKPDEKIIRPWYLSLTELQGMRIWPALVAFYIPVKCPFVWRITEHIYNSALTITGLLEQILAVPAIPGWHLFILLLLIPILSPPLRGAVSLLMLSQKLDGVFLPAHHWYHIFFFSSHTSSECKENWCFFIILLTLRALLHWNRCLRQISASFCVPDSDYAYSFHSLYHTVLCTCALRLKKHAVLRLQGMKAKEGFL